jgi:unsaturated chondroitin disaccharide hydrolase
LTHCKLNAIFFATILLEAANIFKGDCTMATLTDAPTAIFGEALAEALHTIRRTIPAMGAKQPCIGRADGTYERCGGPHWVEGFWSGQLWLAYAYTGEQFFSETARQQRSTFVWRLAHPETHDHDLGFLFSLSAVADYKLTGDLQSRAMALEAAHALAKRFNPRGQFIRAWNDWGGTDGQNQGRIIIDSMENLALLFWAAHENNAPQLAEIATAHALCSAQYLVRPDGSTYHTYRFDPESGAPIGGSTHQGYSAESCWSRGQAWAIHGFALAYAYTQQPRFLQTACQVADYALAQLPADGVPFWDYRLPPEGPWYRDSSAAAINAAGLLLLAEMLNDEAKAVTYRSAAEHTLTTLIIDYTTFAQPQAEGLLHHSAYHVAAGHVDIMMPYGDYFFVEALLRTLGHKRFFW